jgi:hypothetical protein
MVPLERFVVGTACCIESTDTATEGAEAAATTYGKNEACCV